MMTHPYGSWPSAISAAMVAAQGVRLGAVSVDGDDVYWLESRPAEGGRTVLVRQTAEGHIADAVPAGFNVRTRVHEYGGGAYAVSRGTVVFSNFADQRLYRVSTLDTVAPTPLTPEGDWCFADIVFDDAHQRVICVREDRTTAGAEPVNTIVGIPLSTVIPHAGELVASGYDFYSTPRLSADGRRLCWICWRHPNMPWDGTELWVADVADEGALTNARRVAGGPTESIYQPGWTPDASLVFASDRDGWWRLYRYDSAITPLLHDPPARAEFGRPEWVFGTSTWAMATVDRLVAAYTTDGRWRLATIDLASGTLADVATPLAPLDWVRATPTHAVIVAASPTTAEAVVKVDHTTAATEFLSKTTGDGLSHDSYSVPEALEFPTTGGSTAHAFYYPPFNSQVSAPAGQLPPLIVISHGGPTTATRDTLDLRLQYWTSRGFAVADVNYSGSSGYGREYRDRLKGGWGIADVMDMIDAAQFLVRRGKADARRLIIRGASAGGYSTLAALAFHPDVFHAGASYYGIADLEVLATDTHKFESRYLDSLVGPYPANREEYRARSPIHAVDRLSCALILFQGLEDQVVPPNQSRMMADAVRAKGLPVASLTFAGEQHGFRRAETIVRCLEAELAFYGAVFGFAVAAPTEPLTIDNLSPSHAQDHRDRSG